MRIGRGREKCRMAWGLGVAIAGWERLTWDTRNLPYWLPYWICLWEASRKVANGHHVTMGYCNHCNYEMVAKCPDHNHKTRGVLWQLHLQGQIVSTIHSAPLGLQIITEIVVEFLSELYHNRIQLLFDSLHPHWFSCNICKLVSWQHHQILLCRNTGRHAESLWASGGLG